MAVYNKSFLHEGMLTFSLNVTVINRSISLNYFIETNNRRYVQSKEEFEEFLRPTHFTTLEPYMHGRNVASINNFFEHAERICGAYVCIIVGLF
jgi:hypothetical protein